MDDCIVMRYHRTMGRRWSYPLLHRFRENESYSFSDILRITHRTIHRTRLSETLKEMIDLGIIEKDSFYRLTERGKKLKRVLNSVRNIMLDDQVPKCHAECIINSFRV